MAQQWVLTAASCFSAAGIPTSGTGQAKDDLIVHTNDGNIAVRKNMGTYFDGGTLVITLQAGLPSWPAGNGGQGTEGAGQSAHAGLRAPWRREGRLMCTALPRLRAAAHQTVRSHSRCRWPRGRVLVTFERPSGACWPHTGVGA